VIRKLLLGLALAAGLIAACSRPPTAQPSPTAEPATATPAPTDTPAPTPTPLPSAEEIAARYLSAWQAGDYAAMYAALAPSSQSTLPAADFEQQYRGNLGIMSAVAYTPTVTGLDENGDAAEARVHITYATQLVGNLETDVVVPLARTEGRWGIVYAPAMIWPELVDGKQLYMVPFVPDRGTIYDRNGVAMAAAADAWAVGVVPGEITPEDDTLANGLGRLLGRPGAVIAALWEFAPPDQYLPIATVSAQELAQFSWLQNVAGIRLTPYTGRFYFGSGAAAHVTGYTTFLQPEEVADYQALGYAIDQRLGRIGLEGWAEPYLAGRNGGQLTLLDAAGQPLRAIASSGSTPSQDVYATVDLALQEAAQFALGAFTGAAVAIRVDTGEVIAIVSNPSYDPNLFEPANLNAGFTSSGAAGFLNRAAQDGYPAGSIFKIVTFAAGLTSGLFTPETLYACDGTWEEIGPSFVRTDWLEEGHGEITLSQGLSGSCNPYFWHVGKALFDWNPNWLSETARAFGLGTPTGITELSEIPGQIPDPEWKRQTQGAAWEVVDSLNLAIGQGDVKVTPLQIARLVAAIANGGQLRQPQLVLKIQPPDGEPSFALAPIEQGTLPLSPEQLAALQAAMHNVTQPPLGTARNRFRGFRIPIYGKTGTAETAAPDADAWFAGYTFAQRADRPDIALAVWVSSQGQGSDIAAPIFRRIVESYFQLPLTRYPWEESVGVVATPEPTATPEGTPGP
jgi:penicillin-binding protein 2